MEQIAAQYDLPIDEESDEELEVLPKIATSQALQTLSTLRLFYEQQEGKQSVSDQSIISILDHQEQLLLYKSQNSRKQAVISSYFT